MLAIRMQRTGRKGHAMFRVVVQDSHRSPNSGKIVTQLGNYDPHTKSLKLDKEKAAFYLKHGAQPSGRVTLLFKKEGVKLPEWAQLPDKQESKVRNPEKRRSTRPDEPEAEETPAEKPAESEEKPTEETSKEEAPAEEKVDEKSENQSDDKPTEAAEDKKSEDKESAE
jgi:small subunit ribosomal protein S16